MTARAFLALVLLTVPAAAQPARPSAPTEDLAATFEKELDALFVKGGLTAEQAAVRAKKVSPTVRVRAEQLEVAIAEAATASLARVPIVGGSATYTRLSPLDSLALGPGVEFTFPENSYAFQGQAQIAISDYLLYFPNLVKAARLGTDAARLNQRQSELTAAQDARVTYYEWVRATLDKLIAERQLAQVRATLGQVRALADAQRVSRADLMRVESEEAQAEQVADQLARIVELREEQVRILIGATSTEPLAIGEDIRVDVTAAPAEPLDELVVRAQRDRLDFQAVDVGIEAREAQRKAERAGLFPKLSAFGTVDYANPNQRVFPTVEEFRFTWQAGLQLTWTLNETLITNAQDKKYAAQVRELRANRENLENGARLEVLSAQQGVLTAQRTLVTSQKRLAAAEESYRVRQALLAAERATAVELIDAETELSRARITALNSRVNLRIALVQLVHAIGADAK